MANDEGLPTENKEIQIDGDRVEPEQVGDGVLDTIAVANNVEWGRLQEAVDAGRADFPGGNEAEVSHETPRNSLAEKIKDWPEEAQDIYTRRLAARLFRATHPDGSIQIGYGPVGVYGGDVGSIKLDREILCRAQIDEAQNSLLSGEISDGSWNANTPKDKSMLRSEAMRVALAGDKQRIREGIDLENPLAGDFDGGLVAIDALEHASKELSVKINQGLDIWAQSGELPKYTESGTELDKKLNRAIEDAIRIAMNANKMPGQKLAEGADLSDARASTVSSGLPGFNLISSGVNYAKTILSSGNILVGDLQLQMALGDLQLQMATETRREYPNLHGFLSLDNVIAYTDQEWKRQEDEIKNRQAAQRSTAEELSADLAKFLSE